MNLRTKILLGSFAGMVVLYLVGIPLAGVVLAPLTQAQRQLGDLEESVEKKKDAHREVLQAQKTLKEASARSLPPDRFVAANVYQEWLIDQASRFKLRDPVIALGRTDNNRQKDEKFFTITATVKGRSTLKQWLELLDEFHRVPLLHRVTHADFESKSSARDGTIEGTIQVEAMALTRSPGRAQLFAANFPPLAKSDHAIDELLKQNMFARGYNGPPKPPEPPRREVVTVKPPEPPKPVEDPFDAREFVRLVGTFAVDETGAASSPVWDGWLFDVSSDTTIKVFQGGSVKVAGFEAIVLAVGSDYVLLQSGRDTFRLEIGQSLKDMQKLATGTGPQS